MADVGAHVYDYFRQRGYSPAGAAGIVGNFQQESGLNPQESGGGLDQGQGARYHPGNLQQQLNGIYGELQGSEAHTARAIQHVSDPRQAALIFSKLFERPGVPMNEKRAQYAAEALRRYGGREVAHASAAAGIANEISPHIEPAGINAAQSSDLASALQAVLAPQRAASAPATAPARPQTSGGAETPVGTPRVPQAAQAAPQSDPTAILSVLSRLAGDASAPPTTQEATASIGTQAPKGAAGALTSRKGIVDFGGHKVAAWIAPILQYVASKGVTPQITSGYRSKAEQERIYDSGVRPAAVPGTSNHEGDAFPRGAVDIANAQAVANALKGSPYEKLLVYAGSKDPVHFSHPHNGAY